ncbi:tRNA glutamyl-Q(34) synthetase GluQRS [Sedimenticola sp.]|uniref:tRNA glutamyl-Q(34) synthetase GluQRS n=1 Tax=Sedimenticola sp. TaxID=1940285 RepID=UPI0025858C21|nr:tRNA glutamyl-Q(34) synthetase GluQRS [Sedimenticola sp.]MCW8902168.1 tRNA glutamyl-Q(34) synthetase GluQRS [Sedimenticola sp.]
MNYRGRFAPSPSGPLHFGSLVAAMGSYLDARKRQGKWLIRIEDIDPPREVAGAADSILRTLESLGFEWDESVLYQSTRLDAYGEAMNELQQKNILYPCFCSRSEIQDLGVAGAEGVIYPGTCRTKPISRSNSGAKRHAIRLITQDRPVIFTDEIRGAISQNIAREIGDFILRRADGLFAYQLAVVVDDAYQGITDVVRGADLLTSTPRQIYVQQLLDLPTPNYKHLPLVTDKNGQKLSKRLGSDPINMTNSVAVLTSALSFLNQPLPPEHPASIAEFWRWAIAQWNHLSTIDPK